MRQILGVLMLFFTLVASSQTKTYVGLRVGGHGKSVIMDHTIFNFVMRDVITPGINAGILVKYFPKKRDIAFNSGIQIGINYSQKGWVQNFDVEGEPQIDDYRVDLNYLEIPIEGIGYFGKKNKYFIAGGFLLEYLLNYSKDPNPPIVETPTGRDLVNNAWNFATYEPDRDREIGYGIRISGGIFRDFSFGSLHLEGYFTYSFSNVLDAGDLTDQNVPDVSNLWTFGASVAYLIPFGKLDMMK